MATVVSPGRRAAALLAFATVFAVLDVLLALGIHAALGEAGGWVYRTGTLVHALGGVLFGALLGLPYARAPERPSSLAASAAASGILFTLHAAAYQIHAAGGHLPTFAGLSIAASASGGTALLLRSLGLGALAVVLLYVLAPRLAPRLEARTETAGGRLADLLTALLFGTIWLATVIGADGPLYYGATPPIVHLAFGAPQTEVDAPAMTNARHVHAHRHGHGRDAEHAHRDRVAPQLPEDPPPPDGVPRPPPDVRALLQQLLQSDPPRTVPDPSYPFCRGDRLDAAGVARRSVLLVDLSGAAPEALAGLGDAVPRFGEVTAPATAPLPGLVSALSGVPALVELSPLARVTLPPVPRLPGLASDLRGAGFRTAAFESTHLAHEDRGALLRVVGFEHLDGPGLAGNAAAVEGPGRSDAATVDAFLAWQRAHRRAERDTPYLALLALRGAGAGFEAEVARLVAWHRAGEDDRGTIVVFFSDHAPQPAEAGAAPDARTARFHVPLAFLGLTEAEAARARAVATRAAGLHDLPQTLLALLGSSYRGCHQGVDLLQRDDRWPDRRVTVSFFGASQETMVAHDGDHLWIMPRQEDRARLYNLVEDRARADDLWSESDSDWAQMKELRDAYVVVLAYLRKHDRFVPPEEPPAPEPSLASAVAREPVRVASLGFGGDALANPEERLEAAIRAGFGRIRLEVELAADGTPVVAVRDAEAVPLAGLLARFGRRIAIELVVPEGESGLDPARAYERLRALVAVAKDARGASIRFATSSAGIAFALAQGTDLPVGLELGALRRGVRWLDLADVLDLDFVTLDGRSGDAALVQRAHNRGLEVTLDDTGAMLDLSPYEGSSPDALSITALPEG